MDMRRILQTSLLTTALAASGLFYATGPAFAQMDQMDQMDQADASISFDSFQDQLAAYGYWLYSDRWGVVWQPSNVSDDFRPYYGAGHWVNTDEYGWYWASDYPWGDIPFHYGRWVNDPDDGWLWMPGYVWSPGWVTWRSNGQYIGWMPMPPDDAFFEGRSDIGLGVSFRFGLGETGGLYGYSQWYGPSYDENRFAQNWVFVGLGQITAPDYRVVAITNPARIVNIIHATRNVTNYTVVNNYVVNRSIDVHAVERVAGHPIPVVHAATVIRHPNLVATVAVGQRVQVRMRTVAPRGRGMANSAPPPSPHVVAKLSTNVTPRNGHAATHLFTKATVTAPEAQSRFHGAPVHAPGEPAGTGGMAGPGGAVGPNGERPHEAQPGMMGPNGERPHEAQPGMMGPNGERPHEAQPGMMGPNGERPQAAQPGTMGPNGERPREAPPGAGPGGAAGPQSAQRPEGEARPHAAPPNPNAARPENPPKKKEPPPGDQEPPH
jgi:hypothetical protein